MKLEVSRLSKNPQITNFMKIRPVRAELFYADRQTDRHDKAIVAFRNFRKAPKNALNTQIVRALRSPCAQTFPSIMKTRNGHTCTWGIARAQIWCLTLQEKL